ncbi:MAG: efflux RND transporter periplasmic adaptor subunit, partial [Gemmatimonadaceae bacterium]
MNFVRRGAAACFASTLLALVIGCGGSGEADSQAESTAVNVRTAVATSGTFNESVGAIGTVSARPGHIASLSAPAPTRITAVRVAEGDRVAAGATLVVFEQTLFREAQRSAQARLVAAQRAEERARSLTASGILPRKDLEQAVADLAAARSDLVVARRTAQLSVLTSPIAGVVTRMSATLGASVDANQPLVEVADPSALDVTLAMSPTDAAKVRTGNSVELRSGQSRSGERLGVGVVRDVSVTVDSATRNVSVRVAVPASVRALRIGETVYGDVAVKARANAISVPAEALVPEGDGFRVFVVDASNVAHATDVTVGTRDDKRVEIISGLTVGEKVV